MEKGEAPTKPTPEEKELVRAKAESCERKTPEHCKYEKTKANKAACELQCMICMNWPSMEAISGASNILMGATIAFAGAALF